MYEMRVVRKLHQIQRIIRINFNISDYWDYFNIFNTLLMFWVL